MTELFSNKKILLFGIVCLFSPLALNLIANNPILPIETVFLIFVISLSTLSGELVYWAMMYEVSSNTMDTQMISPINKLSLVLGKISAPIVIIAICTIGGSILNDIVASTIDAERYFNNICCCKNVVAIISVTSISAILELAISVNLKNKELKKHTIFVALEVALISLLFYTEKCLSITFPIFICSGIFLFLLQITKRKISAPSKGNAEITINKPDIFPGSTSPTLAIFFSQLYAIPSWIVFSLRWVIFVLILFYYKKSSSIIFSILLFLLYSLGITGFLYPSLLIEKEAKIYEIINVSMKKAKSFFARAFGPFVISQANIFLSLWLLDADKLYGLSTGAFIFFSEGFTVLSILICILYTERFVSGIKDSRAGKLALYCILFFTYVVLLL